MSIYLPAPEPPPGMPLAGRRVVFFGMGRSGLAGAEFLRAQGADTTVIDEGPAERLQEAVARLEALGATAMPAVTRYPELDPGDLLVLSPGVPADHHYVQDIRGHGVEVIGEIELAYRFCAAPLLAVAGTNGKGSTTTLLGAMLAAAGRRCTVAGNIGTPLVSVVQGDWEVVVAEVSSFQLETIVDFRPWAAILLNVTPDHLARHGTFEAYVAAKQRLFMNQREGDLAVLNVDNEAVRGVAAGLPRRPLTVSLQAGPHQGFVRDGELIVQLPGEAPQAVCGRDDLPIPGDHLASDALCAAVVAVAAGCTPAQIRQGIIGWQPAAHQLAPVGTRAGVRYIDDSKATNPEAAIADLATLQGPVYVIAGGQTKGASMAGFADYLAARAAAVFLIGEGAFEIAGHLGGRLPVTLAASLQQAVQGAAAVAPPGATVILAPACASFDQFQGQAQRGEHFAEAVRALSDAR